MSKRKLTQQQLRRIDENNQGKLLIGERSDAAIVITHMGFQLIVEQQGQLIAADWRKHVGDIAINDRVIIEQDNDNHAVVEAIYPREKTLYKYQGRKIKPVASNIDQLLIVIAVEPLWQNTFIDRYLVAAKEAGISVGIFCNKEDLITDAAQKKALQSKLKIYESLGYPIFMGSVKQQISLLPVAQWLKNKQTVICGQSGVGKSSLIRHLVPQADIWIQSISKVTGLGKHTTTNSRRYPLDEDGAVIDTPGVRGFAITHLDAGHILAGFPDIAQFSSQCRFSDCQHTKEPGCAILAALKNGEITQSRYDSMMQLFAALDEE